MRPPGYRQPQPREPAGPRSPLPLPARWDSHFHLRPAVAESANASTLRIRECA